MKIVVLLLCLAKVGEFLPILNQLEIQSYLMRFGHYYHPDVQSKVVNNNTMTLALKHLQAFAGIPATGVADQRTMQLMNTPRCGVSDDVTRLNYTKFLGVASWNIKSLTYAIKNYPSRTISLSPVQTDAAIRTSFNDWSSIAPLTFTKVVGSGIINLGFYARDHGDNSPFDGVGGVLAHSFYPKDGRLHFDDDETWTMSNTQQGRYLRYITTHELGHSLGLGHTSVQTAVMYPYYKGYQSTFRFDTDDINGIQSLYGRKI